MDLLSVDPVLLRTFRVVMARRSMARAADELGFVPSAVSQHVSRLERLVGTQLLIRTPGEPLAPTAAGRQVDQAAGALLGGMADFVSACRDASGGRVELRIAMYASAACELLPAATVAFKRQNPDDQVRMVQAEPDEGLAALTTGAVDLVIAYRYLADEAHSSPEVRETLLGTERLPLVRSAADPDAPAEWIGGVRGSPSRRLLEQWASVSGVPVDVRYEAEDPHTVLALCAAGLGQGIVPVSVLVARQDLAVTAEDLTIEGQPLARQVLAMTRRGYVHPLTDAICGELRRALAEFCVTSPGS
jgi:DNA-binding transcriptional LysR family regulator